jgi:tungstate transport system ATP-binding protein
MSDILYSLSDVEQIYDGRCVLRLPSFEVQRGEILALVGPSGAGKSTLLRLLALLEAPAQGQVNFHLNGHPVTSESASTEDRRQMTMLFQRPLLLSRSVYANVAYGLRLRGQRNGRAQIDNALERVSMTPLAESHPRTLSGGEAQRVAIARALVLEPRVLLFDEPTANLDPYNVRIIEKLVKEQNRDYGTTIVLVTHDIFQAKRLATRVGLLVNGELLEVAPADEFFNAPKDPRTAAFLAGDLIG